MNAAQVIDQAVASEQETLDDFYTTAELNQWLNDGLLEFIDESGIYKAVFSVTMVADTADYAYPSGLIRPEEPFYDTVMDEMDYVDVAILSRLFPGWRGEDGGDPAYFYEVLPGYVSVYPKPNSANAGKILSILGVSEHAAVAYASATAISIPKRYHTALVEYLLYRMITKDDRAKDAAVHYANFLRTAVKARTDARQANRKGKRYSSFPSNIKKT